MKLQHTPTLASSLHSESIFIDSTVLIDAAKSDEFLALLIEIAAAGCTLYTIPSVVFEYTRTANTLLGYNQRLEFIKDLGIVVFNRVEELLEKDVHVQAFTAAYNVALADAKGPSYTDSLLCLMAYKHRAMAPYILTANHKDMPLAIFDRTELVTIDIKNQFQVEAFYQLSEAKLGEVLRKL